MDGRHSSTQNTAPAWRFAAAALVLTLLPGAASEAWAEGNPTRRAIRLDPLEMAADSGFSVTRYEIETGVYYKWTITSDGLEEYKLVAPELFGESWIDQVVIADLEVKPAGLRAVEFDAEGSMDIWFIVLRPGEYNYGVEGLQTQGFSGVFAVR
ncbi:hypothetical protein [Salipiger mangrovisoli]|uniref:Copper-binding protein n=1 Tax=Salipiger mangrovisoli TaxID=2865933 RepID=A0ABR9X076_9RHOB|nr:hypothetical protein [Salipiger mangrovisoli]MBE9636944.1 hypothetical protein [Salipiger mangrovisoli]